MDSPAPKVSFIPKSPLAREESFFERKRPRSVIGTLATVLFIVGIGSYAGLYFYNVSLAQEIVKKTTEINDLQATFSASKEVAEAKVFRSRAEFVKELLDQHVAVSPIFSFLSKATLQSIMYEKFSFTKKDTGWVLDLSGEAPSYASLAYQADVLRKQNTELVDFSITNVALSKFGTVTFDLALLFAPEYIRYTKDEVPPSVPRAATQEPVAQTIPQAGNTTTLSLLVATSSPADDAPTSTSSPRSSSETSPRANGWTVVGDTATATLPTALPSPAGARSWWSWFKFW